MAEVPAFIVLLRTAAVLLLWITRAGAGGDASKQTFRAGQEWRFAGRPSDPKPTLVIVKVEALPKVGDVVHISVRGVQIRNSRAPAGYVDSLPHLPFSPAALQRSVTSLVADSVALPNFEPGYEKWRQDQGGVFTISVREALDLAEQALK